MAVRYSFECPKCSTAVELTVTQAGQEMTCQSCAEEFSAPRLGDIKKLPVVGGEVAAKPKAKLSSPVKGWLFAGGLLLAVVAGAAAYGIQSYAASMYSTAQKIGGDIDKIVEDEMKVVDAMPDADIYAIASEAHKDSFQLEYRELPHRSLAIQSGILHNVALGCWAVCGIGAAMLLSSFFVGKS